MRITKVFPSTSLLLVVFLTLLSSCSKTSSVSTELPSFNEKNNSNLILSNSCNMTNLNELPWGGTPLTISSDVITIKGWGVDLESKKIPKSIFVVLKKEPGSQNFYISTKLEENKLPTIVYNNNEFLNSGYNASFESKLIEKGTYSAAILMESNGKSIYCASGRTFTIN